MSLINFLKSRFYPTYAKFFSRAYLYEGTLKSGKGTARSLFIDNDKFYLVLLQKLYVEPPTLIRRFRCWVPGLRYLLDSRGFQADICVANVSLRHASLFDDTATFKMQTRVTQTLDLASAHDTNKRYRDARKRICKKINKFGLSYKISRSNEDFDYFYHRMSKPLIRKFGNAAMDMSYEDMWNIFNKGLLILVYHDEQPIAGLICLEKNDSIMSYRLGLLDGDQAYLEMGAQSACYYFLFEYANQQGYQKVDFMRSMPFLNDGVYVHKRLLGARVEAFHEAFSWVYVFNCGKPEMFAKVIENIPLIVYTENGPEGVLSLPGGSELTDELTREIYQQYSSPGLNGLRILHESGRTEFIAFTDNYKSSN